MTFMQTVALVLVVLIIAAAVFVGLSILRRRRLQTRFGPEYDRVVAEQDGRGSAERVLRDRERRHDQLELTELDETTRQDFARRWRAVQATFVEDPAAALTEGDALFTELVAARGYPTEDFDEQLAVLSVDHARPLDHYRQAHEIYRRARTGRASTEDQRQALVHYREIIADLLGTDALQPAGAPADPKETHHE